MDAESFILPSRGAFLRGLDLDNPHLLDVKNALGGGDVEAATRAYAHRFRAREISSALISDWSKEPMDPAQMTREAEDCLRGVLRGGYDTYEVPEAGIDWHNGPLSTVTRFPIFGALLRAYHHSGRPEYARFVVEHGREYMKAWPLESFVGTTTHTWPSDLYTVFPAWWWCMLPNRLDVWCETVFLLRRSTDVSDEELVAILERMHQETRYMAPFIRPEVATGHNAGGWMTRVLATCALIFEDFRVAGEWLSRGAELTLEYLRRAFYPDGFFKELATGYSVSVSDQVQRTACAFRHLPEFAALAGKLRAVITAHAAQRKPNGFLAAFGDLYPRSPVGQYLCRPLIESLNLSWAAWMMDGEGRPPPFTHWPPTGQPVYGGYYVMRSDWGERANFMVIDGGPWGTNHQHCDRLSFALSAHGVDFLVDPCCTLYHSNDADACLSPMYAGFLHNTVTVDGVDEYMADAHFKEVGEPLNNLWAHNEDYALFAGVHDFAPVKPLCWERRVVFVAGRYWLLQDLITGDQDEVDVEQNFQFNDDIAVAIEGASALASAPTGERLLLQRLGGALTPQLAIGDSTPHPTHSSTYDPNTRQHVFPHGRGWVARFGKHMYEAPAVTYCGRLKLPAMMTTALIPMTPDQEITDLPEIRREAGPHADTWVLPTPRTALRIETGPGPLEVAITAGVQARGPGPGTP